MAKLAAGQINCSFLTSWNYAVKIRQTIHKIRQLSYFANTRKGSPSKFLLHRKVRYFRPIAKMCAPTLQRNPVMTIQPFRCLCHFLVLVVSCPAPPVYLGNISFLGLQWGWRLDIIMDFLSYDSNWVQNFGLIKAREIVEYFLRIYQILMDWILWMYSSLNKFSYCIT